METFDVKVLRKTFRLAPRSKKLYDETRQALRAERLANLPGPGNLRDLKNRADKDAMHKTYETIAGDASYAQEAKHYDATFAKEHGAAAVSR